MDEESVLFGIRNLFALGNYQTVINEVSSTHTLFSTEAKLEAKTYLYRAYLAQGKYNLVLTDIPSTTEEPSLLCLRLLASYMQQPSKELVNKATEFIEEGSNLIEPIIQVVVATILVQAGQLEDALRVLHSRQKKLECSAMAVQIYLLMNRLDLAKNEIIRVKEWAEDALLLQMMEAWLDMRMGGEKYQEAFYIYEELAQSNTGQTVKVLNGQAATHMALGRYTEAETILLEALNKDSNDPDTLINMITCATLTAKSTDVIQRYISLLKEVAPHHPYIQEVDLKSSLFDRCSARYSLIDTA